MLNIVFYNLFNHFHYFPFSRHNYPYFFNKKYHIFENKLNFIINLNKKYLNEINLFTQYPLSYEYYFSNLPITVKITSRFSFKPLKNFQFLFELLSNYLMDTSPILFIPHEFINIFFEIDEIIKISEIITDAPIIGIFAFKNHVDLPESLYFLSEAEIFEIGKQIKFIDNLPKNIIKQFNNIFICSFSTMKDILEEAFINEPEIFNNSFLTINYLIRKYSTSVYFPFNIDGTPINSFKFFFKYHNKGEKIAGNASIYSDRKFYIIGNKSYENIIIYKDFIIISEKEFLEKSIIENLLLDKYKKFLF